MLELLFLWTACSFAVFVAVMALALLEGHTVPGTAAVAAIVSSAVGGLLTLLLTYVS